MKMKRAAAFLLALCMAVSLLHVGVLADGEAGPDTWAELAGALREGGAVALGGDVTADSEEAPCLEVPEGTTVTLDLNGFAVDGSALSDFTLYVRGTLTLKDSRGSGKLVGSDDGAIYVDDGGKCTVTGGAITAENADYGAVYVYVDEDSRSSVFTVSGAPEISSVYLTKGAVITVGGALTWATPLPVKTEDTPTDKVPVIITSHLPEGGRDEQFISVDPDYAVYTNARSGEAELRPSQTDESIIVGNNYPVTLGNTYAFTPLDDGAYVFYSVGEMDTVGTLYLGEDEIADDDNSGEGRNFRISAFLNAGSRCRLCVRGNSDDDNGKTCTVVVEYRAVQTISFASATQVKTYGDADFTVTATGAQTSVSYQVTDGDAATVDSATGAVHIVKAGTATITATAEETSAYASATASYTLTVDPKTVTIPTAATGLKWTGNEQTGVASGEGYSVTNGAATAVGNYTATATLDNSANYKWSDNTTAAKSIAWSIGKANSPAAPTGLTGVAPTTDGGSDGRITGVTTEMEYSADGSSYTPCSGTEITGLSAGTYYVRYQETATHEAGAAATVSVPAYGAPTTYSVTVTNGTGGGSYAAGDSVTITANEPETGKRFKAWTGVDGLTFTSGSATTATAAFTMPARAVNVTATYEDIPAVPVTGVTLNRTTLSLTRGNTATLTATVAPSNATNKAVTWSSGSPGVATVDANGKVTAVAVGTAIITVTTTDGGKTAQCTVTVSNPTHSPTPSGGGDGDDDTPSTSSGTTTTTTNPDGSKTTTTTNADGSKTVVTTAQDGCTATVKTDKSGSTVSVAFSVSQNAVEETQRTGAPIQLPAEIAPVTPQNAATAAVVAITVPNAFIGGGAARVEIEVTRSGPGVIAMLRGANGGLTPVKECYEGSVILPVTESCEIVIVDNTKQFSDVKANDWFYDSVTFVTAREIFNGTGDGLFTPNASMTRGMLAQALYNFDRSAAPNESYAFADARGKWYAGAASWAASVGVVTGTDEGIEGEANVTREAVATMLYRYAKLCGYDVSARGDLSAYGDAGSVSDWAREAMQWAVGTGLVNGMDGFLAPQAPATRAQLAAIIERFVENVVN